MLLLTSSFVSPASDYIIKEKTVLLQKKDSEGFGFVLRGAKGEPREMNASIVIQVTTLGRLVLTLCVVSPAQTPIEEFTPTPAFPALQYLESVDEGGVAWRAGLRMGDFLIEVLTFIFSWRSAATFHSTCPTGELKYQQ